MRDAQTVGGILAAGEARRLGPLGLQLNKALIPVGQRPLIAHQLNLFREASVTSVVVLILDRWEAQVTQALRRSHPSSPHIRIATEIASLGPGPSLRALAQLADNRPLVVLLADTWIDDIPQDLVNNGDWVGVARAPASRMWCVPNLGGFDEKWAPKGTPVAIGAYRFSDSRALARAADDAARAGEFTLSDVLRRYSQRRPMNTVEFASWWDVGTFDGLRGADGLRFRHRIQNSFSATSRGEVVKRSDSSEFRAEIDYMRNLDSVRSRYFPRVFETGPAHYTIELVELPTLAYLYLYWPPVYEVWKSVMENIVSALTHDFWPISQDSSCPTIRQRTHSLYVDKLRKRISQWSDPLASRPWIVVNGRKLPAGKALLESLEHALEELAQRPTPAFLHGDLNFGNILYGMQTGRFKLLDPRGDCGGPGPVGDLRYDLAKLRYSYHAGFSAICDNLFRVKVSGPEVDLDLPLGEDEGARACDEVLTQLADLREIALVEASILVSAIPIHSDDPRQQIALYTRGVQIASEALG